MIYYCREEVNDIPHERACHEKYMYTHAQYFRFMRIAFFCPFTFCSSLRNMKPGYYAGYVASSFTFGRFVSGYVWGHFTDSVGRKPTILIGLLSMAVFSISFGVSPTYSWALSSRCVVRCSKWLDVPHASRLPMFEIFLRN